MTPQKYNQINELIVEYSTINASMEKVEAQIKQKQLEIATPLLPEYAQLMVRMTELEGKLRTLADEHYEELFPTEDAKRTHNTPFGALSYRKSSSLEFDDEEKVLLKIKLAADDDEARHAANLDYTPRFTRDALIRVHEAPNLEALDELDDLTLALFGIKRVKKDNFQIKPPTIKTDKPAKKKEAA